MSYTNYPKADWGNQKTGTKISPCSIIPNELILALKKTYFGYKAYEKVQRACKENYRRNNKIMLQVNINKEPLNEPYKKDSKTTDHAQTYYKKEDFSNSGVVINITTYATDRMKDWSDEEKMIIISAHEMVHLKYIKRTKTKYRVGIDNCGGFWSRCHLKHFEAEFKSRLEYSLLFPKKATPKKKWIEKYYKIFEIFERFFYHPIDSEKKEIREIKNEAKQKEIDDFGEESLETNKIIYDNNELFKKFIKGVFDKGNFKNGEIKCFELYNDVINTLIKKVNWLDGRVHSNTLKNIKTIIKSKNKYLKDSKLIEIK